MSEPGAFHPTNLLFERKQIPRIAVNVRRLREPLEPLGLISLPGRRGRVFKSPRLDLTSGFSVPGGLTFRPELSRLRSLSAGGDGGEPTIVIIAIL